MSSCGNDWLALTLESTLEPEIPICDAHHHLWDLRPERNPYQHYLLPELYADLNSGHKVCSTVFVETRASYRENGPEEMRPVGEVEFAHSLADIGATGLYGPARAAAAIVGHANLHLGNEVARVLEELKAASPNRFRGIRHLLAWDQHSRIPNNPYGLKDQLSDWSFRSGARVLARWGLSFDAWVYFPQLPGLVDFARAVPDLTIILNHIGGLLRVGPYADRDEEVLPAWMEGIAAAAQCDNVYVKLGGFGQPRNGYDWSEREQPIGSEELAETMAPYMHYCIEQFGPNRCMFESNFPVDKVGHSYNVLFNAFKRLSNGYSDADRAAMFQGTAERVYRISERCLHGLFQ